MNSIFEESDGKSKQQSPNSSKRFWSFIMHARTDKIGIASLKSGDSVLTDSRIKAEVLNKHFKSAFSQFGPMKLAHIAKAATQHQMPGQCSYPGMPPINITVEGVKKLLSSLNPYKAVGPDSLHPRVLKELSTEIAPALCKIFRASLQSGVVPSDWKLAFVTPIYKKGPKQFPENYRPVSLTCICTRSWNIF